MSLGSSAPEFFTAVIGAFKETDVGFSCIVGSAVFNVLFIIGSCILFAKETLVLSWYPLTRDCIWYTVGLIILSIFFAQTSPMEIEMWESVVLFGIYVAYLLFMMNNPYWEKKFTGKCQWEEDEKAEKEKADIELK